MQVIFGVDPGSLVTGYGVIEESSGGVKLLDFGCIKPPKTMVPQMRYRVIFEGLLELLDHFTPVAMVLETQYVSKNPRSTIMLAMARGAAMLAASMREIPTFEYAPSRAKNAVTGSGRASKEQVQRMVQRYLQLSAPPKPEDASDALALALCHFHVRRRRYV